MPDYNPYPSNITRPSLTVITALAFKISGGSMVIRSFENTVRSARLPTSSVPRSFSRPTARAEEEV